MSNGKPRIKTVKRRDGSVLALADLPPTDLKRWRPDRKADVIVAVRGGLISIDDAYTRYGLTADEFLSWCASYDKLGVKGLRITRQTSVRAGRRIRRRR